MYQLRLKKELREVFDCNSKLEEIANELISCIDDQEDDGEEVSDLLYSEADSCLIYLCDQWAIIENYSDPDDPISFNDALDLFIGDLTDACFLEETEEE